MKKLLNNGCLATGLFLTAGCALTSQFQPIQRPTSGSATLGDSASVTVFLLERDLPPTFERLGPVAIPVSGVYAGVHKLVQDKRKKIGREQGANGAIRIGHGTYEIDKLVIVSYLLFRYAN